MFYVAPYMTHGQIKSLLSHSEGWLLCLSVDQLGTEKLWEVMSILILSMTWFGLDIDSVLPIECEGCRQHSSLIFLILLFTKPNIEVSGWLYLTKTHFTHIDYKPFLRVSHVASILHNLWFYLPWHFVMLMTRPSLDGLWTTLSSW